MSLLFVKSICDYGFQRFHGCRNMHMSFAKMLTAGVGAIPDILRVQERASAIRKCYISSQDHLM